LNTPKPEKDYIVTVSVADPQPNFYPLPGPGGPKTYGSAAQASTNITLQS